VDKSASIAAIIGGTVLVAAAWGQAARDYINVVGSSTVYPFATVAAERFGRASGFKTPKIEATGSGGGIKLFCAGIGVQYPDIANSSRRIKTSELTECGGNGVKQIVEVKIGYDGIVLANSRSAPRLTLTRRAIFLALAKQVPDPKGGEALIPNPYQSWQDIDATLPAVRIEVLGPPPTSGTRDAFVELAMEGGCQAFPRIAALKARDEGQFKAVCHTVREDGRFIEAGENDNLIVHKLKTNPNAVGVFGYSFLEQNEDSVQGSSVDGELPTFEAISSGAYPVSRPLFVYVKKAHIGSIPGLREFVQEFTSAKAIGADGYLADRGLIPLPASELAAVQAAVSGMKPMDAVH